VEKQFFAGGGFGRDFGGSRLRYIAERLDFRAQARNEKRSVGGPRQCDGATQRRHCANVTCRDKNLIQLESLILAQSERWRQA
jgi:hypothetical protein